MRNAAPFARRVPDRRFFFLHSYLTAVAVLSAFAITSIEVSEFVESLQRFVVRLSIANRKRERERENCRKLHSSIECLSSLLCQA